MRLAHAAMPAAESLAVRDRPNTAALTAGGGAAATAAAAGRDPSASRPAKRDAHAPLAGSARSLSTRHCDDMPAIDASSLRLTAGDPRAALNASRAAVDRTAAAARAWSPLSASVVILRRSGLCGTLFNVADPTRGSASTPVSGGVSGDERR